MVRALSPAVEERRPGYRVAPVASSGRTAGAEAALAATRRAVLELLGLAQGIHRFIDG